jgi:PAS domain S-box-containing protein
VNGSDDKPTVEDAIIRSPADATQVGMAFQLETSGNGRRRFTYVGQRCLAVNGVSAEDALENASLLYDMILPEHRPVFAAAEAAAAAGNQPFDVEIALRRADGAIRWHRLTSIPHRQPDGRILWDGLQIDVTHRREMAAELEGQRRRIAMAVEAGGLGFWEWDLAAEEMTWSERNRQLYGLAPDDEITAERYMEVTHPEDRAKLEALYQEIVRKRESSDFSVEHRVVTPAGVTRWLLTHGRLVMDQAGEPLLMVGTSLDITERQNMEERRGLLLGELAHRSKNGIGVIMAIVAQTARGQKTVREFEDLLMARLQAMAASIDVVTEAGGGPVDLLEVATKTLAVFGLARFDIDDALQGVTVRGEIGASMGLLLHEMATNAVKYGALSAPAGRVVLARSGCENGTAAFQWREVGGPEVRPATRQGFGTRLLQQALRTGGGQVTFDFKPKGFEARIEFPTA